MTVTVLSPDVQEISSTPALRFIRIRDIPFVPQLLFIFPKLMALHQYRKIDLLYSVDSIAFIAAAFFGRLWRVPTVFNFQASIFYPGRERDYAPWQITLFEFTNRFAARVADRVICISQEIVHCARYAGATADRLAIIPNSINLAVFQASRKSKDGRICLYVGALRPIKGVEYLIRAIPKVLKRFPETRFVLVGDGPDREKIARWIAAYGLSQSVELAGYVFHDRLPAYYQQADLFVMPSLNEAQGLVALEAMACGLPVVASQVGGIPEMIQDGHNGLLVPPKDSDALAGAIIRVLDDRTLRGSLSQNALQAARKFSWEKNINKFVALFSDVCDRQH